MSDETFKKYILLITFGVVLFVVLSNTNWVIEGFGFVLKIMAPFLLGAFIAIFLNVFVNFFKEKVFKKIKKEKTRTTISVIASLVAFVGIIALTLGLLLPQLFKTGTIFVKNFPEYQETINELGEKFNLSEKTMEALELNKLKESVTTYVNDNSASVVDYIKGVASSVGNFVYNFFIGLVFAVYLITDKERLKRQFTKLFKAIMSKKLYDRVLSACRISYSTFTNFVVGQLIEATILGSLCFVGMLILRLPYAGTLSVLSGLLNMVPYFGAFFGTFLGTFLIFMVSPVKALIFFIFTIALQQIEANIIYPHVVGGKVGLPSIWVLLAVIVGGSVAGFAGIVLAVPVVSILYGSLKVYVNKKVPKEEQ